VVGGHTRRLQQTTKPFDPGGLQRHAAQHHLAVQLFEKRRMRSFERLERNTLQRLMRPLHCG